MKYLFRDKHGDIVTLTNNNTEKSYYGCKYGAYIQGNTSWYFPTIKTMIEFMAQREYEYIGKTK